MRIQHNIMAMNAYRNYNTNVGSLSKNLEKLSSGYRINRAGDDAAGLAISEKMRAQITGLDAAQKNVQDGISLVKTAEGALQEVQDMLNRMVYLANQSANGTYDSEVDRANLQKEVDSLRSEINRIADSANFNGIKLLDGSLNTAEGITTAAGTATQATPVPSALASALSDVTAGKKNAGETAVDFSGEWFMTDLTATSNAATSQDTTITIKYKDIDGGADKTLTLKLASGAGTAAANKTTTATAVQIQTALTSAPGTSGDITVADDGASGKAFKDLYNVSVVDGKLTITAKSASFANDKKTSEGITSVGVAFAAAADKTAAEASLKNDLDGADGATTPANIAVGAQSKDIVAGKNEVKGSYTVASAKMTLVASANANGTALTVGGKTYLLLDKNTDNSALLEKLNAENLTYTKVSFDKGVTNGTANSAANALIDAINADSAASHINAKWNTNAIQLQEDEVYGKSVLADTTGNVKSTVIDATTVKASSMAYGAAAANQEITLTSDLEAGSKITIGNKVFQFAADADSVDVGVTHVQFTDGNAAANTTALLNALKAEGYNKASVVGGTKIDMGVTAASIAKQGISISNKGLALQIGDTSDNFNRLAVNISDMHTASLKIDSVNISTLEGAQDAIDNIKNAINSVSMTRGTLGATQNRLEHTTNNLSVMKENITNAESAIRDTDVADEMMKYTKNNILIQSAQAMLAQANQVPQGVLQLLQ